VFVDDEHYNSGHGHAYEKFGIDAERGATVIVRPDQCMPCKPVSDLFELTDHVFPDVSKVMAIDDTEGIGQFFDIFCAPKTQNGDQNGHL